MADSEIIRFRAETMFVDVKAACMRPSLPHSIVAVVPPPMKRRQ